MKKPIRVYPKSKKYKPWTRRHGYKKTVRKKVFTDPELEKARKIKTKELFGEPEEQFIKGFRQRRSIFKKKKEKQKEKERKEMEEFYLEHSPQETMVVGTQKGNHFLENTVTR